MPAHPLPTSQDPIRPAPAQRLTISLDGRPFDGVRGQTLAGVLLASGVLAWRRTSATGAPRGAFCGIGICFDCLVVVNGQRDVRACQRRAVDGDVLATQHDPLPDVGAQISGAQISGAQT